MQNLHSLLDKEFNKLLISIENSINQKIKCDETKSIVSHVFSDHRSSSSITEESTQENKVEQSSHNRESILSFIDNPNILIKYRINELSITNSSEAKKLAAIDYQQQEKPASFSSQLIDNNIKPDSFKHIAIKQLSVLKMFSGNSIYCAFFSFGPLWLHTDFFSKCPSLFEHRKNLDKHSIGVWSVKRSQRATLQKLFLLFHTHSIEYEVYAYEVLDEMNKMIDKMNENQPYSFLCFNAYTQHIYIAHSTTKTYIAFMPRRNDLENALSNAIDAMKKVDNSVTITHINKICLIIDGIKLKTQEEIVLLSNHVFVCFENFHNSSRFIHTTSIDKLNEILEQAHKHCITFDAIIKKNENITFIEENYVFTSCKDELFFIDCI